MAQGKPRPRKGSGMLAWRSRQKPGKIMKPSTFSKISKESPGGEKAAGAAYWKAAHKKYKESRGIPER